MIITADELTQIMPLAGAHVQTYLDPLNEAMQEFAIDNPDRIAAFIAQLAHESAQLSRVEENLNYSAERLTQVWTVRFPSLAVALPYSHNPQRLANHVYANRLGNGDEASGDGWRFRGAGLIQLTGRENQTRCATFFRVPVPTVGDWLRSPEGAARSAAWFWWTRGLSSLADTGQFTFITRRINGALVGLDERCKFWETAKDVLA